MKSAEPWIPGRERAGPPGCFSIPVTSLFQCALHTPRSPMQSQAPASQGGPELLYWWQLYQKCPSLHFKKYLAILYSCFWGWQAFQFYYEIYIKRYFWPENEDRQYPISQGSVKHRCWLLFVPNGRISFYTWRPSQRIESVKKGEISSVRTPTTNNSDSKRVNTFFPKNI